MNLEKIKKGDNITFEYIKDDVKKEMPSSYIGKFDFAHLFDTKVLTLPIIYEYNKNPVIIINLELLNEYEFDQEEVKAILHHEIGHIISRKQKELEGIDLEFDADDYAVSKTNSKCVISALTKTENIVLDKSSKTNKSIEDIKQRINKIKNKEHEKFFER